MADVTVEGSLSAGSEYRARRWKVATTADVIYEFFTTGAPPVLKYRKSTDGGATWGAAVTIYSTADVFSFDVYYDKWAPNGTGTKIHIVWLDFGDAIRYRSLDTASDTLGTQYNVKTGTPLYTDPPNLDSAHLSFSLAENGDLRVYFQFFNGPDNGHYKSTAASAGATWTERTTFDQGDHNDLFMLFPAATADDADICVLWWDDSASEVKVFIHDDSANSNSAAVSVGTSLNFDLTSPEYWQWSAQARHSDGHIILAVRNEIGSTGDIRVFDITPAATPTVSELTAVLSNTAGAGVDVFIDQNTDDIYIAWLQGTLAATTDVYYAISTDNGSTWGTAVGPVNETAADDYRNLCSNGMVLSGDSGRYALSWVNDDTDDLMTNKVNSVSISAGGGSNYNQSAAGTMGTLSATLVLKTGKALSGVSGSYSATLVRLTGKALAGTSGSSSAELAKSTTKSFAGTMGDLSATLSAIKTALVAVSGTAGDLTGSITRQVNKALVGVSGSVSGILSRLTSKSFSGADGGLSGALNASAGKFVELAGVAGDLAGTLAKQTLKSLSGVTGTVSGAISKQINKALSGASGSISGTLSSSVYKVVELAGAAGNLTGTLTRSIAKSLAGTAGSISGSIAKAISKSFSGTMGALSGSFTTFAPTEYLQSITGSISSITGSVTMAMVFRRAKMKAGYAIRSIINGGRRLTD